jgi:hypothetical protein
VHRHSRQQCDRGCTIKLTHPIELCRLADAQCQQSQNVNQNRYRLQVSHSPYGITPLLSREVHSTSLSYRHAEIKAPNRKGFYGHAKLLVPAISMMPAVKCSELLCGVVLYSEFSFLLCSEEVQVEVLVSSSSKSFCSLHQHKWLCELSAGLDESLL